jgi:hypothetical protein
MFTRQIIVSQGGQPVSRNGRRAWAFVPPLKNNRTGFPGQKAFHSSDPARMRAVDRSPGSGASPDLRH